ncbi:MAG: Hsp70 family protein [Bacteroidaceae bacterium]|nr:Hsp70 family protein [Bacteroidaceae bacterium]
MVRLRIDYGIDLGTTNSSICRMENGEPVILRTDTLREVMPSCVSFTRRKSAKVGDSAYNDMKQDKLRATHTWQANASNTYIEFKRTMGTDTIYHSENMQRDYTSEELSAMVLQTLRSYVNDDIPRAAVITVPAKFTVNQKTATIEAARLAGFEHCQLLQEPIAAAMAYGLSNKQKNGLWLVFDFGGGTFDAALLKVEEGIVQVIDTEGDNYLGGKNIDYAIVDNILLPHLGSRYSLSNILGDPQKHEQLRDALKTYAEEAKIQLSYKQSEDVLSNLGDLGADDDGEEMEIDLTITRQQAFEVMRPIFQKAVDICLTLLRRNNLKGSQVSQIILVGGPTRLPLIHQMLEKQVAPVANADIDPMTVVARGAALYASTLDMPAEMVNDSREDADAVLIDIGYEPTTVELTDWVSLRTPKDITLNVELSRSDGAWSSGRIEVTPNGRVVTIQLEKGRPNTFQVKASDREGNVIKCLPEQFVVQQGTKVGSAILPYHIGISVWNDQKQDGVFLPLIGLEKNKPLPAVGVIRDRRTTSILRPGIASDILTIPVYQADDYQKGMRSYLYEWVADVVVTGDEVPQLVPVGSMVEVTIKADRSEQMTLEVYLPESDVTIKKELPTNKKQSMEEAVSRITTDIASAYKCLYILSQDGYTDIESLRQQLQQVEEENRNSQEKKAVLQHLKEILRKIEALEGSTEWQRVQYQLETTMRKLAMLQETYGDGYSQMKVHQLELQVKEVKESADVRMANLLLVNIKQFMRSLEILRNYVSWVYHFDIHYESYKWRDAEKARKAIDKALEIVKDKPTKARLDPLLDLLFDLRIKEEEKESDSSSSSDDNKNEVKLVMKEKPCNGLLS